MKLAAQILFPIVILCLAYLAFNKLKESKKPPESKRPPIVKAEVSYLEVTLADHAPPINTFGTVQSYFETAVVAQAEGEIIEVSEYFRVGRMVKEGDVLARIKNTDYQAALAQEIANLALAKQSLVEEEALCKQVEEDWRASGRSLSNASDFALRKPQLETARANVISAEALVQKATSDLEDTSIVAPYDALITERTVSLGNLASSQQSLGRLVATEKAVIRLPLTPVQAERINLALIAEEKTISVILTSPAFADIQWAAEVTRVEGSIDSSNQVMHVIAEVKAPYSSQAKPLAIGSFVNAKIESKPLTNTLKLSETSLVNNQYIWILDDENRLKQLEVIRLQTYNGEVYLRLINEESDLPLRVIKRPLNNFKEGSEVVPLEPQEEDLEEAATQNV